MGKKQIKSGLLLALTAFIWGTGFVSQIIGMDYLQPFTFNGLRCLIGGVALLPCIWLLERKRSGGVSRKRRRLLVTGGLACGLLMFAASSLQQVGIQYTTAGKAGFITAMYIVIVPVLGLFGKRRSGARLWLAVGLALVGLYCLCMTEGFRMQRGDLLLFLSAIFYALHILVVAYYSPLVSGVKLSCIQFFVAGVLSLPVMFLQETVVPGAILRSWAPLLYCGVISCGVAYTLQIIGQRNLNPTVASLIMSLESVFSVLAGWVILHEVLSMREALGCIIMFAAIILAQLPEKKEVFIHGTQSKGS